MKPNHPEICPRCGQPTFNWYYLAVRIYIHCEHCGYEERGISNTPTSGVQVSSDSRVPATGS